MEANFVIQSNAYQQNVCIGGSSPKNCPAIDATCRNCSKRGHFTKVCLSAPRKVDAIAADDPEEQDVTDEDNDGFFLGEIKNMKGKY